MNDRWGHPEGDRVLAQIGAQLRRDGEAFRLGGDEFGLLLPGRHGGSALDAAEAILRRIDTHELAHCGSITASAGLATFPADGSTGDELIRLADSALYRAKGHGKNRARTYRPTERAEQESSARPVAVSVSV